MAEESYTYLTFNRGLLSRLGLGRIDLDRTRLSAQTFFNYMPRVLGSMMLRPGLQYLGSVASDNPARMLPFVFATDDKALIELTDSVMRVWVDDALVTRASVSTTVANGGFDSDLTSWTDNDEAGGTSAWVTGGYMGLTGNGTAAAIRDQSVTVTGGDQNVEHALNITIQRGPVVLRVGTATTDDAYINETTLETGAHSLSFTPTGNFNIRLLSRLKRQVLVDSVNVASSGVMTLATPWAAADLDFIRARQSADVIFIAMNGYTQRRIERRNPTSWSLVHYLANDGPFRDENLSSTTMTPGALSGNTTLTASATYFRESHAPDTDSSGALFRVTSNGQQVTADVTAENSFTDAIRVTGTGSSRPFTVIRAGTWSATVTLQRSLVSENGPWLDVTTYTTNGTVSFDDGLDNQIAWYRIGVKTGDFTSGTVELELNYSGGSIDGICRVTGYVSETLVNVEVIDDFGGLDAVETWAEGDWSRRRGWPSAVSFHEGRLGWGGKGKFWLSISDAFNSFDDTFEGDAGPINRSIGSGPVDTIHWMESAERLLAGGQGSELSIRSSGFDEPLSPSDFQMKDTSSQGSAAVDDLKVDRRIMHVQKSRVRVYELAMDTDPAAVDYGSIDLTQLVPEVGEPSLVRAAVQRQPDTRLHFVRSDGQVAMLVFDKTENVIAWINMVSDGASGLIEDVVVLPGETIEDEVYYVVQRTINGGTVRYLEKWAMESEAKGTSLSKIADAFITYEGAATVTITGLDHLEGEDVVVWAAGADVGTATSTASSWTFTYTVSSGQITLAEAATDVTVGLPYRARWQSSKMALANAFGTPLTKRKRIPNFGIILADTHAQGLLIGRDFTNMDNLPQIRDGAPEDLTSVVADIDEGVIGFPGEWSTDARICLESRAPRPATVLAFVAGSELHEQT